MGDRHSSENSASQHAECVPEMICSRASGDMLGNACCASSVPDVYACHANMSTHRVPCSRQTMHRGVVTATRLSPCRSGLVSPATTSPYQVRQNVCETRRIGRRYVVGVQLAMYRSRPPTFWGKKVCTKAGNGKQVMCMVCGAGSLWTLPLVSPHECSEDYPHHVFLLYGFLPGLRSENRL